MWDTCLPRRFDLLCLLLAFVELLPASLLRGRGIGDPKEGGSPEEEKGKVLGFKS